MVGTYRANGNVALPRGNFHNFDCVVVDRVCFQKMERRHQEQEIARLIGRIGRFAWCGVANPMLIEDYMNQYQTIPNDILDAMLIDIPDLYHHVQSLRGASSDLVAEIFERDIATIYLTSEVSDKDTKSLSNSDVANLVLTRKRLGWELLRAKRAIMHGLNSALHAAICSSDTRKIEKMLDACSQYESVFNLDLSESDEACSQYGRRLRLSDDEIKMLLLLKNK